MNKVSRTVPGLRSAMFDVLDQLRGGEISHRAARSQMETAKTICLTVVCERQELEVVQKQIEVERQIAQLEDQRKVIEHVQS
jgi:hypothetical protein